MRGDLQQRINPHVSPNQRNLSQGIVKAKDNAAAQTGSSFRQILGNSNADKARERAAKIGDDFSSAKTDEEFFKMLTDRNNPNKVKTPSNKLDKDSFLKLFITQIQSQDPLNPDDSAKMAAQLAQFQGLEQMMNVNKTLEKMTDEQATSRAVNLIDFVGKDVHLENGKLHFDGKKFGEARFTADKPIPQAILEVRDGSGGVVAKRELGNLQAGQHAIEWDGKKLDGNKAGPGVYTVHVLGQGTDGQQVPVKIRSTVKITGVDLKDKGGSFYTELGKVNVGEIAAVGNRAFAKVDDKKADEKPTDQKPPQATDKPTDAAVTKAAPQTPEQKLDKTAEPSGDKNPKEEQVAQAQPKTVAQNNK